MAKVHKIIHLTKRRGMNLYCQHVCLPIGQGTVPEVNPQSWTQPLLFVCEEE